MLTFGSDQLGHITLASFEQRVRSFVVTQARSPGLRALAARPEAVGRLWEGQRHHVAERSEHDAAVLLCFVLACEVEKLDASDAANQALSQPQPEQAMKLFLSERGHFRFSDFDLPLEDD